MNLKCFILRNFFLKTQEQVSFKKRYQLPKKKLTKNFGNIIFFSKKQIRFEPIYFNIFRKWLKLYLVFKKYPFLKNRIWISLNLNYPISRKSKNARMGKGKGSFFRWTSIISKNHKLCELSFLNDKRLYILKKNIKKKLKFVEIKKNCRIWL